MRVVFVAIMSGCFVLTAEEASPSFARSVNLTEGDRGLTEVALGWHNESALGFTLAGGNSDAQNLNARERLSYAFDFNRLALSAHYLFGRAQGSEVANNWSVEPRFERYFSPTLGAFVSNRWEGNRFAGIDYRANADAGAKVFWLGSQGTAYYLFNELGYRYQYESRIPGQSLRILRNHFARIYTEARTPLTETVWVKAWVELLPNFNRSQDYLINFEPSLGVALSNALSLQLSILGQFDGFPSAGKKNFDYVYTTSIIATL